MTELVIQSGSMSEWFSPNPFIDICVSVKKQVIEIKGIFNSAFNAISQSPIEERVNISNIKIAPYQMDTYEVIKPIDASIECLADNEFIATFDEAEVSFTGDTITEAINALKYELIEVYKLYSTAEKLGPRPKRQLSILENYIAKKTRQPAPEKGS